MRHVFGAAVALTMAAAFLAGWWFFADHRPGYQQVEAGYIDVQGAAVPR